MKSGHSILEFLEDGNMIKYNSYINTPERIKNQKYIIKGMIKLFKRLDKFYKEKQ